jgi:DNA-binding NtrC family response regulator
MVLIVEDAEDCGAMLEVALQALPGVATIRVATAEAALEAMGHPDLAAVITDVHLPKMSGIELIAHAGGVPVVAMSASADPKVKRDAMQAGAAAFFAKPFSPGALCGKVRELLEESGNV